MPDGEALPLDVRPRARLKEVKGRAVYDRITELRQLHGGRDWVRFECADACKLGSRCHGESIRRHWYRQQQIDRGADAATDAGKADAHVCPPCRAGGGSSVECVVDECDVGEGTGDHDVNEACHWDVDDRRVELGKRGREESSADAGAGVGMDVAAGEAHDDEGRGAGNGDAAARGKKKKLRRSTKQVSRGVRRAEAAAAATVAAATMEAATGDHEA